MKYKQRIFMILAFAAVCCFLVFLGPALTDVQFGESFSPFQSQRKILRNIHFGKGQQSGKLQHYRGSFGAHLNFMRKDLDLSNYTGDNNSSEIGYSDLFGGKHRDVGKQSDNKAKNVINELNDDDDLFNNPRNTQESKILSHLKEILIDDDTFLREGNLENLLYLAKLIKHSTAKTSAHRVLTKKDILEELTHKLQSEGVIIPAASQPTTLPVVTKNVIVTQDDWSALNKVRPSMFSGHKKQRRGRGPLLNIYPRPRK